MDISIIVAMSENRVIGINNTLPWHLPADLQHFKSITMGKPILMGRKTFDSIGRPLPGRQNIVVTRDPDFASENVTVVHSPEAALEAASDHAEVMIVGGASFYEQMLPHASRLYLTIIHQQVEGDAHFPNFNQDEWETVESIRHAASEKNPVDHSFLTLQRRTPKA